MTLKKKWLLKGKASEHSRSGSIQHHRPALREDPVHVLVHSFLLGPVQQANMLVQTELDPHRWHSTKQHLSTVTSRVKRRGRGAETDRNNTHATVSTASQAGVLIRFLTYSEHITPALNHPH